jgi:hypothetical protein
MYKKIIIFLVICFSFFVSFSDLKAQVTEADIIGKEEKLTNLSMEEAKKVYNLYESNTKGNTLERRYQNSINSLYSCVVSQGEINFTGLPYVFVSTNTINKWKEEQMHCLNKTSVNFACGVAISNTARTMYLYTDETRTEGNIPNCSFQRSTYISARTAYFEFLAEDGKNASLEFYGTTLRACRVFGYGFYKILKDGFNLLKLAAVLGVIIFGMLDYLKGVTSSEQDIMKKVTKNFMNRLYAAIIIFILPFLIDMILSLVNGTDFVSCISGF